MKNSKKIRGILIAVIAIVALGYLVTNLDFQTVSEHDRKSQEMERELGLVDSDSVPENDTDTSQTASSENAPVRTEQEKENQSEKNKTEKELKKKKKSKKNEKKTHSKNKKKKKETDKKKKTSEKKSKKDSKKEKPSKQVKKTRVSKKKETNKKQKNQKEEKDNNPSKTKKDQNSGNDQSSQVVPPAVTPQVEQKPTEAPEKTLEVTISITCKSLLPVKNKYPNLKNYIPDNGIILSPVTVKAKEGDSVYDVLTKICLAKKIHYDSEYNSFYKSYYVKGIAHLYEQQAGDMSGWLYFVNGKKPNYGSSAYKVKNGDVIVWGYTLDGYEY